MRVLFIGRFGLSRGQTGDATQLVRTMGALDKIGWATTFLGIANNGIFLNDDTLITIEEFTVLVEKSDLVHLFLIPKALYGKIRGQLKDIPVVMSPIYWFDWARVVVGLKNAYGIANKVKRTFVFLRNSLKWWMDFREVNAILPNSPAEAVNVLGHFRLSNDAIATPVVNAFVPPEWDLESLPRPKCLPECEYIVYPGVFAERKNQLQFIKAVRELPIHVVFMGGVIDKMFYNMCLKAANERMHFVGYIPSASKEYWAILFNARCACLASDCETPGIALLEAGYSGARPVVTEHGGTVSYYGCTAEYLEPTSAQSIKKAVWRAWERGRLSNVDRLSFGVYTWNRCVEQTIEAYRYVLKHCNK